MAKIGPGYDVIMLKYIMTSKVTYLRHEVKKLVMALKVRHDVKYLKIRHDVKKFVKASKIRHDVKNTSLSKLRLEVKVTY